MSQQFFQAIADGKADEVRRLLGENLALAEAANEQGLSPLMVACYHMKANCIALLKAQRSRLTLCEAAAVGSPTDVQAALESELVNTRSPDGFSPLHLAAFFGNAEAAGALVQAGAEINVESANGARLAPLNSAAAGRNAQVALAIGSLLLSHGADPNHPQTGGYTPLHSAAANGNMELVQALLRAGADRTRISADGKTAAMLAKERGHEHIAEMLAKN